ncbi:chemotaxis protein CheW [Erythrobacter litoralis]|uniref:chemotaxis protein CheW n=1 Tax=Erythrobacter litoralis TaxID=39960 RepID=UPI00243502B7|nr:chemotaxis protein CheW [Erythrobacter litoralis]MDG6077846.1 chemotaxis protein CheW [Erythrobacter litoralis]
MSDLLLVCRIAGQRIALPAMQVQSVIEIGQVTPIPGTPNWVRGLTTLRSQALTVIDCADAIGLTPTELSCDQRAAVMDIGGHPYALLLDEAEEVSEARSPVRNVPGGFGDDWARVALGMVETDGEPALLLDIEAIIDPERSVAA